MAHVDNLIERIPDPHLRAQIAEEVAKLVEHKDFGLVFQRHLPEDLEIPGTRPRRGDIVRLRADAEKQNYVVLSTRTGVATIIPVDAAKQTIEGSESAKHPYGELVVVKDFSVPIYPGLAQLGEIRRGGDKPTHVVIEGENYYALETLLYTHERKVDLIYIDPPYNTGADDWIYNDRFVASTDTYRHSKWLSFIERRLLHAKRLLKPTGLIIVAIGEDEHHRLRILMDQIFGQQNFLANVVWIGSVKNDARFTGGGLDYMLVYAQNQEALIEADVVWREPKDGLQDVLAAGARAWEESGRDAERATRLLSGWWAKNKAKYDPGLGDNVKVDLDGTVIKVSDLRSPNPRPNLQYDLLHPTTGQPVRRHPNGWVYSQEKMLELVRAGRVLFGADHTSGARKKTPLAEMSSQSVKPTFYRDRRAASKYLESMLGKKLFPNPKDADVLARWIRIAAPRNALILDFFGGSGTTAEAAMRLNGEDGGTRQAILITNNEVGAKQSQDLRRAGYLPGDEAWEAEGVFQKVTRPRVETVIEGTRPDGSKYSSGLHENVAFFKLTYEDENLVALGRRFDAVAPLLWLKAGGVGPIVRRREDALWALPSGAIYGVLFVPAQAKAFAELIAVHDRDLRHLFVVTDSESEFQEAVGYLPAELRLETTRLYADYLHSFEINGKG